MRVCVSGGSRSGKDPIYEQAAYTLGKTIAKMGFRLDYGLSDVGIMGAVARGVKNGDIIFKVNGENINNLIGYHGETLEAVQFIVNTIVRNRVPKYRKKVYLDVENYRRKRQETVEAMAERIAKKVLTTKRSIKLEPMN